MLLRGITHVLITTVEDKAKASRTQIYATAELCFGPGDANSIAQLYYQQNSRKQMSWKLPTIPAERDGVTVLLPVFTGDLASELTAWAANAMDRIKKELGNPKMGRIYRVSKAGAEDITNLISPAPPVQKPMAQAVSA